VARSSYVDPRVVQGYEEGVTIAPAARRAARTKRADKRQLILENATVRLIRKITKG
jgi:DNA topoisomerase-1